MKKFLSGAYAVLMSPFVSGRFDSGVYAEQIKKLCGNELAGYVVNGSTAEFIALSQKEKKSAVEIVFKNKETDKQVIVSACSGNVFDTLEMCKFAGKIGAGAALVCPPYYFKHTVLEREKFFLRVADASSVPIVLYNIPFFTQEIELNLVFRLLDHENIIGIKDSSANMKRIMHLIQITKNRPGSVLIGTDDILYPSLLAGADGSMTAFATIFPRQICEIYKNIKEGKLDDALKIQNDLLPYARQADALSFPKGYKRLYEQVSGLKFGDREAL